MSPPVQVFIMSARQSPNCPPLPYYAPFSCSSSQHLSPIWPLTQNHWWSPVSCPIIGSTYNCLPKMFHYKCIWWFKDIWGNSEINNADWHIKTSENFHRRETFFFFTFSHLFLLFNHGASLDWAWLFWLRHLQPPGELPFQAGSAWDMPAQRVKFGLLVCRHPPQLARPHHLCPPPPALFQGCESACLWAWGQGLSRLPLTLSLSSLGSPSPGGPCQHTGPQSSLQLSFLPPVRLIPFCYFATFTSVSGTLEVCVLLHLDT